MDASPDPAEALDPQEEPQPAPGSNPEPVLQANPTATSPCADIVCLSEIQLRPVDWLWQHRLASGTIAMLSGGPGVGKTFLALAIAAALSRGRAPLSEERLEPCTVLYASTQNAASEVIRPRFEKLDGDLSRLVLLRGISSTAQSTSLRLRDTAILEDALQRTQARLLIVDPLHGYFGPGVDSHHPGQNRATFDGLAGVADKHRCCILLIRPLSKRGPAGPVELSGALRTEFLAGSSPDAPSTSVLVQLKSNLGPLAPALGYTIDNAGRFTWTGVSNLTAEELLGRPTGAGLPKRKFVAEWLRQHLRDGGRSQYSIEVAAQRDGVCVATLRRAKFDIGVTSTKDGIGGAWSWSLPAADHAPQAGQRAIG